jgi:hypothetical protein
MNAGNGTFTTGGHYGVGPGPYSVTSADVDLDGDLDLATAGVSSNTVSVLLNQGSGTFAASAQQGVGTNPRSVTSADLDGDGDVDLATANFGSNNVSVLRNDLTSGTPFCFGDGSGTACPCGNNSAPGTASGCLNSFALAGRLRGAGLASLANDHHVLTATQMPSSSALYFQGTTAVNGGAGAVFGDGLRCAGGSIIRLGTTINVSGASQYPETGDPSVSVRGAVTAPGLRTYQVWYRNSAAFCSAATFNLTNGWQVNWTL